MWLLIAREHYKVFFFFFINSCLSFKIKSFSFCLPLQFLIALPFGLPATAAIGPLIAFLDFDPQPCSWRQLEKKEFKKEIPGIFCLCNSS